jgi:hypothetical protein
MWLNMIWLPGNGSRGEAARVCGDEAEVRMKLRYRGLKKNAAQLFAVCALVNLYLARKKLLLLAPA